MLDFEKELKIILKNDPLNILVLIAKNPPITSNQRLIESFKEINKFIEKEGKEPTESNDIHERKLFSRLKEIRKDFEKISKLEAYDTFNILGNVKKINNVTDIFENDVLGILDDDPESIFKIKNINKSKNKTDFVARRKQCKDFTKYEDQFKLVQKEISAGKRKLLVFKDKHCKEGGYYILDGILLFLEKIEKTNIKIFKDNSQGIRKRDDPRTRCIFENGMESNMYLRSLQKELYNNGSTVIESNEEALKQFDENFGGIKKEDKLAGHIYVLSSLSQKPEIQVIKNLYKIGYCTTSIDERIKGAEKDPTYLMAPVKIISSYKVYNLNPQKFENLIHIFFNERCLDVKIADNKGKNSKPKEWYVVPIKIIERVIQLIISGEIINFKYDSKKEVLIKIMS
tara:strand:- start:82 stop:1278 length:1197 start_codon:yes stop_codon:yes gene_type:complete